MFNESNRTHKFVLRLTPEEYTTIKNAAENKGVPIAAYIRQATYKQLKQDNPGFDPNAA